MGNLNESDKKSHAYSFLQSVEGSYISQQMVDEVMRRWQDQGKPLYMVPKDFKEKILASMDNEMKLNYLV
jgi:predicted lipoprotein with Yx(FWY)xxD motif